MKIRFSTIMAAAVFGSLLLPVSPPLLAGDAKKDVVCTYCKDTNKVEIKCPTCRGTGLGKEVCPACKGRRQAGQRCSHCKGKDLTKEKCLRCRGKDLTKQTCPDCKGKGRKKGEDKDCWTCNGTGKKLACRYCKGTGKQEQCWYCKGTGRKSVCDACGGTGRKTKCLDCGGTGKKTVGCKHCKLARLTAPKKLVSFFAASLRDIVVAVTAGKTYMVSRSEKPILVDPFEISGVDKDGKVVFTQPMKFDGPMAAGKMQTTENELESLDAVKGFSVKQLDEKIEMKSYEKDSRDFEEFLKKGQL